MSRDDDELPIFRPKRRTGTFRDAQDSSFRLAVLAGMRGSAWGPRRRTGRMPRMRIAVRAPRALERRVIVKARVIPMHGDNVKAAALHLRYIERDGVEHDGRPGHLYSSGQVPD